MSPDSSSAHLPKEGSLREILSLPLLLSLAAMAAVAPLATDTYLPAFTDMAADLDASASQVQLTMTTFLVGVAVGQLGIGILSDRYGRRPLLLLGTLLALLAGIGTGLAPSLGILLLARFLQGLGGAAGMVLGRAVIADLTHGITTARALGLVMAIQGIAPVVAPIMGGLLVGPIGWRGIMYVVAGFTALLLAMIVFFVPESLPKEQRHDGGFSALAHGIRTLTKDSLFMRLVALGGVTFALLMAYLSATPFLIQSVLGMSTAAYTLIFTACAITMTIAASTSGAMAHKVAPARQIRIGLLLSLVVDVVLAAVAILALNGPTDATLWRVLLPILLMLHVLGIGMTIGNVPAVALGLAGRNAGTASAFLGFVQFVIGGLVSPLVGLSGETSALAFGVVILVAAILANLLALPGVGSEEIPEHHIPELD